MVNSDFPERSEKKEATNNDQDGFEPIGPEELSVKMEGFCQWIARGETRIASYRGNYDAENMQDSSCSVAANQLMHNAKIVARIKTLRRQAAEAAMLTHAAVIRGLMQEAGIAEGERAKERAKEGAARVKALELLGRELKMFREHVEHTVHETRYDELVKEAKAAGCDVTQFEQDPPPASHEPSERSSVH